MNFRKLLISKLHYYGQKRRRRANAKHPKTLKQREGKEKGEREREAREKKKIAERIRDESKERKKRENLSRSLSLSRALSFALSAFRAQFGEFARRRKEGIHRQSCDFRGKSFIRNKRESESETRERERETRERERETRERLKTY